MSSIDIINASLRFKIYKDPSPTLKESVVNAILRRGHRMAAQDFFALRNINLSLKGGDRLGILGLNGAGKSTLLKMIVGIYPPIQGIIEIQGRITPMIEIGTGFNVELSGRENIYLNGAILGYSRDEMSMREKAIIDFAELTDFIDMPVKYYSSGMYGRLAFSIATMTDPEILLVDEIFSAGDARFVAKGSEKMLQLFQNSKVVMFVSHNIEQIRTLCNKAIVLHKGELVAQGETEEMLQYYLKNIVSN